MSVGISADKLKIGDIITLKHVKPNEGLLSAQGLINDDCQVVKSSIDLSNCLWQVCVQNQYSAANELEELTENRGDEISSEYIDDKGTKSSRRKHLLQVQRAAQNEKRLNEKLMSMKIGKQVSFGDVIELRHAKSNKYLTASSTVLAKQERENMRVMLSKTGNSLSWLEIMPRYKYDKEGHPIANGTEIFIRVHERPSDFIHAARKPSRNSIDGEREINCSLESSCWVLSIYEHAREKTHKSIFCGQLVTFHDPETLNYLTIERTRDGQGHYPVKLSNPIHLSFSNCNIGTNLLWMIESENLLEGGPIISKARKYYLKDLNSGMYLTAHGDDLVVVKDRESSTPIEIQAESSSQIEEGSIVQLASGGRVFDVFKQSKIGLSYSDSSLGLSFVVSAKIQSIIKEDIYVGVDAVNILRNFENFARTRKLFSQPTTFIDLILKSVFGCFDFLLAFLTNRTSKFQEVDMQATISFDNKIQYDTSNSNNVLPVRQAMIREQGILDVILDLIDLLSDSFQDRSESSAIERSTSSNSFLDHNEKKSTELSFDNGNDSPSQKTQLGLHTTFDHELIEAALNVLFLAIYSNHENQMYISDHFHLLLNKIRDHEVAVICVQEMLHNNLQMLQTKIQEREIKIFLTLLEESEMNVTLMKLLRSTCCSPMGVDSTQQMLANALYGTRDIITLPKPTKSSRGMRPLTISWSKSTSTSDFREGHSQITTMKISTLILKVIIVSQEDPRKLTINNRTVYFPSLDDCAKDVLGYGLVQNGMHRLLLSWESVNRSDFAIDVLFPGCKGVPIEYLGNIISRDSEPLRTIRNRMTVNVKAGHSHLSKRTISSPKKKTLESLKHNSRRNKRQIAVSKSKSAFERKIQVAEFFIAQLYLAADLCLDRNYVSIHILETYFPYDVLLTIMGSATNPNRFKAPVCRLLRTLYVDREPQVEAKYPRLIKTSISLLGGDENSFSNHHSGSPHVFGILQLLISDYLRNDFDSTQCDELSAEIVDLLLFLVKFGYYNTREQLHDVIVPLVIALDQHRVRDNKVTAGKLKKIGISRNAVIAPSTSGNSDRTDVQCNVISNSSNTITKLERINSINPRANDKSMSIAVTMLAFVESVHVLSLVLLLVLISTIILIVEIITSTRNPGTRVFDLIVVVFFIVELVTRVSCHAIVHKELIVFLHSYLNLLDILVVSFDIVMLSMNTSTFGDIARIARVIRVFRVLRLIRVMRAARLLKGLADKSGTNINWELPSKYTNISKDEVRTIAGILRVLTVVHTIIQDRKLTSCVKAFGIYQESEMNGKHRDPKEVYLELSKSEEDLSEIFPKKFDSTLADVIMYSDPELTQEALHLLLLHKSKDQLLFQDLNRVQLLYSPKMEMKYKEISEMLRQLKRLGEAYEVWSDKEDEEYITVTKKAIFGIEKIKDHLIVKVPPKDFDLVPRVFPVDIEIQQLLLNLDAMNTLLSFLRALFNGKLTIERKEVRKIVSDCNELISLFLFYNEDAQSTAFKHFDWFLERIDDQLWSSKVIRAMLSGNRFLIKQTNKSLVPDLVQRIVFNGRKAEYLDLFIGMTDVDELGDSGLVSIRNEIARHITHGDRSAYITLWCDPINSPGYEARKKVMETFINTKAIYDDKELPPELQYHINFLNLLAGCRLGPKLQAIYQLDDIMAAILDPSTIYNVKFPLVKLVLEVVESKVDILMISESLWLFIDSLIPTFDNLNKTLSMLLNNTKYQAILSRHVEWSYICLNIVRCFFSDFDYSIFQELTADDNEDTSFLITRRSEDEVKSILSRLNVTLKTFRFRHEANLTTNSKNLLDQIVNCFAHLAEDNLALVTAKPIDRVRRGGSTSTRRDSIIADIKQLFYRKQFEIFITETIRKCRGDDSSQSIEFFERLPSVADPISADVRLEHFILKVSNHIRSRIQRTPVSRNLDEVTVDITIWVLKSFRQILEKQVATTVDNVADPRVSRTIEEVSTFHIVFNTYGVTFLCLDLIAVGIDTSLCLEAIKLLIILTDKEGGNDIVQQTIFDYLNKTDSTLFFEQIKELLEQLMVWCQRDSENKLEVETHSIDFPNELFTIKLIHSMCEGSSINNNILREQEGNSRFVNVLDSLSDFMNLLSRLESHKCTCVAIRVAHSIKSILQGPCIENQEHFVLNTELMLALNRILRTSKPSLNLSKQWSIDLETLKEYTLDVLRACVEGQSNSLLSERVQSTIEFNVLNVLIFPPTTEEFGGQLENEKLSPLQGKYLVFLKSLNNGTEDIKHSTTDVAYVEVVWHRELYSHYFHAPEIVKGISEINRHELFEEIEHHTQESKLIHFLSKAKELYFEAANQELLKSFGLLHLQSWQHLLSKVLFINAVIMNILMTMYFGLHDFPPGHSTDDHHSTKDDHHNSHHRSLSGPSEDTGIDVPTGVNAIYMNPDMKKVLYTLNILQVIFATVTCGIILISTVPVRYSVSKDNGHSIIPAAMYAISSPLLLWYIIDGLVAWAGLEVHPLFLSILLLEFIPVVNPRELILAILNPFWHLVATMAIVVFVIAIFACAIFYFYRNDYVFLKCDSLWRSFKLALSYGVRSEEGIGKFMTPTLGNRIILDLIFYFLIIVLLKSIFHALIIDTFGELRSERAEREAKLNSTCFICGLDQSEFDKRSSSNNEFKLHKTSTHNTWNYLYFLMHIWHQRRESDSSLEMYVRKKIENGDISWFPIGCVCILESSGDKSPNHHDKGFVNKNSKHFGGEGHVPLDITTHASSLSLHSDDKNNFSTKLASINDQITKFEMEMNNKKIKIELNFKIRESINAAIQDEIAPIKEELQQAAKELEQLFALVQQRDQASLRRNNQKLVPLRVATPTLYDEKTSTDQTSK